MKRSRLKRGKELGADPEKVRAFMQRGRDKALERERAGKEPREPLKQRKRTYKPKGETKECVCAREGCENTFKRRASEPMRKFCSRACWTLDEVRRVEQQIANRARRGVSVNAGEKNGRYKDGSSVGRNVRVGRERWTEGLDLDAPCACGCGKRAANRHHVVYEQHVRAEGGDRFDPDNGLVLAHDCHASHHRRGRVLPLTALRDANIRFAYHLLGDAAYDYLTRRYGGEDPRVPNPNDPGGST